MIWEEGGGVVQLVSVGIGPTLAASHLQTVCLTCPVADAGCCEPSMLIP